MQRGTCLLYTRINPKENNPVHKSRQLTLTAPRGLHHNAIALRGYGMANQPLVHLLRHGKEGGGKKIAPFPRERKGFAARRGRCCSNHARSTPSSCERSHQSCDCLRLRVEHLLRLWHRRPRALFSRPKRGTRRSPPRRRPSTVSKAVLSGPVKCQIVIALEAKRVTTSARKRDVIDPGGFPGKLTK